MLLLAICHLTFLPEPRAKCTQNSHVKCCLIFRLCVVSLESAAVVQRRGEYLAETLKELHHKYVVGGFSMRVVQDVNHEMGNRRFSLVATLRHFRPHLINSVLNAGRMV